MDNKVIEAPAWQPGDSIPNHSDGMSSSNRRRNRIKVLVVMSFAVIFGALGDISLSKGMKTIGETEFPGVLDAAIASVTNLHVLTGVVLLIVFMLLYLASLSWEEMTYVLPLTAAIYVLVTLMAYFFLHEDITPLRWAGSLLVAIGIAVVART